jgi:hypothetical protein
VSARGYTGIPKIIIHIKDTIYLFMEENYG